MKTLTLVLFLIGFTFPVCALPVLNVNVAPAGIKLVVWPDHEKDRVFYIKPNRFRTVERYHWGFKIRNNEFMIAFAPEFHEEDVSKLRNHFTKLYGRDNYRLETKFHENENLNLQVLDAFILESNCRNRSFFSTTEEMEFTFYCIFKLTETGKEKLIPFLLEGKSMALNVQHEVNGVVEKSDGTYRPLKINLGIPVMMERPEVIIDRP